MLKQVVYIKTYALKWLHSTNSVPAHQIISAQMTITVKRYISCLAMEGQTYLIEHEELITPHLHASFVELPLWLTDSHVDWTWLFQLRMLYIPEEMST